MSNSPVPAPFVRPHSLFVSIALHIVPGIIVTILFVRMVPWVTQRGYPPLMALLCTMLVGAVGLQLSHLMLMGFRQNGRLSLRGVVLNNEPVSRILYLVAPLVLLTLAIVGLVLTTPLDQWLARRCETFLPAWYFVGSLDLLRDYSADAVRLTFVARLAIDGVLIPLVEELYFRGYLLPRMPQRGRWAPIVHHGLFTLYHFWQPYNYPTIFVATLPMVWWAWRRQSWRLAWVTHTVINVVGGLLSLTRP